MTRDLHYNYIRILSLLDFLNSVGLPRKRNIIVLVWPAWFENSPHGLKKQRNSYVFIAFVASMFPEGVHRTQIGIIAKRG